MPKFALVSVVRSSFKSDNNPTTSAIKLMVSKKFTDSPTSPLSQGRTNHQKHILDVLLLIFISNPILTYYSQMFNLNRLIKFAKFINIFTILLLSKS